MPEIRKVALDEVVANRRRGGDIRVLLSPKTVGSTSGFFGVLTLEPGEYVSEHYHPYSEEFLYVVSGRITARLNGDQYLDVVAGEGVMVPRDVRHRVTNPGTGPAVVTFCLTPLAPRPDLGHVDTEELPAPAEAQVDVGAAR
ncbi:MAG: cupin [Actinobacteria bacterium 13_1_20CM_3_71_11]|nr:MAG: cupin [Actinobacteria bacterium 13_1_20CM_3_71_11]